MAALRDFWLSFRRLGAGKTVSKIKAKFYREQARDLREAAAAVMDENARATLTKIAEEYEQLAQDIESNSR
jgi:hypothetical protein